MSELPPCGIYRTTATIDGKVPADRLVYFHNHGDPGPGIYLPESWTHNRATFSRKGNLIPLDQIRLLSPLPPEGLYRVTDELTCCDKAHVTYRRDMLVQLGYDGQARPILFVPEWTPRGMAFPEVGQPLDRDRMAKLARLVVREAGPADPAHLN